MVSSSFPVSSAAHCSRYSFLVTFLTAVPFVHKGPTKISLCNSRSATEAFYSTDTHKGGDEVCRKSFRRAIVSYVKIKVSLRQHIDKLL